MVAHWILTADESGGTLRRIDASASGHVRVTDVDDIPNTVTDHVQEARRRFAKEVAVWLEQQAERRSLERVGVFAPPRLLCVLREAWSPRFALIVEEHPTDLAHVPAAVLAQHDAIAELLSGESGGWD